MKKGWKIFWIIIGSLAGFGLLLCIAAFAMGFSFGDIRKDFPYSGLKHKVEVHQKIDNSLKYQSIKELKIRADFCEIRFVDSDEKKITVDSSRLENVKGVHIDVIEGDDSLEINVDNEHHGYHHKKGFNHKDRVLYVNIPKDYQFENVEIELDAGRVEADTLYTDLLDIRLSAGECEIDDMVVGDVKSNIAMGRLELSGIVSRDINVDCGAGQVDIELDDEVDNYNYDVKCQAGIISIGGAQYKGVGASDHVDHGAGKNIYLDCGAGQIEIDFAD